MAGRSDMCLWCIVCPENEYPWRNWKTPSCTLHRRNVSLLYSHSLNYTVFGLAHAIPIASQAMAHSLSTKSGLLMPLAGRTVDALIYREYDIWELAYKKLIRVLFLDREPCDRRSRSYCPKKVRRCPVLVFVMYTLSLRICRVTSAGLVSRSL